MSQSDDIPVTPAGGRFDEPEIARDPVRPGHLAVTHGGEKAAEAGTCFLSLSSDDGQTWTDRPLAGTGTGYPLPAGRDRCIFVRPVYGPDGTLYVSFNFTQGFGFAQVYLIASTDGGTTFGPLRVLDPDATETTNADWQPAIAAGPRPGQVYVAFNRYGRGVNAGKTDARVVASSDGGQSFSQPTLATPANETFYDRPFIGVDSAGTVYVSWSNETTVDFMGGGSFKLEVASSTNGGLAFGAPKVVAVAPGVCDANFKCHQGNLYWGRIAGGRAGRVYVAWSQATALDQPSRSFVSVSSDSGATWSAARMVEIPAGSAAHDQYVPDVSVASNGRVDLGFVDQARDTVTGLADVYYTYSNTGGSTFETPIRLTSVPSNTQRGGYFANVTLDSSDSTAYAAWTDTRRGDVPNLLDEDIFFAKVRFSTPITPPPPTYPTPTPSSQFADCPASTANVIRGTAASESINGTPRADRIFAGTGNDIVDGLAGDDCIDLGPGADRGQGGDGDDLMLGGLGADRMAGSSGNDRLLGGGGSDQINGGFGNDRLHGQAGKDRINGSRGRDRINGGSSNDVISGGSSGDRIAGDQGNDRINGNSGNDSIKGNSGNDRLTGSTGRDRLSAGSGNDRILARDGQRDRIDCGSGRDRVSADRIDVVARNCERVKRRVARS